MFEQMRAKNQTVTARQAALRGRLHAAIDSRKDVVLSSHRLADGHRADVVLVPTGVIMLEEHFPGGGFHISVGLGGLREVPFEES